MSADIRPMKTVAALVVLALSCFCASGADSPGWAGQYRDNKFLGGRAVFQLSIEQSGGAIKVSFDAAWNDGHGAAPEAEGPGSASGNTLNFKFEDSFGNKGTGTVTRARNDVVVSINPTHVAEPRCVQFYGKNMRLKRAGK
jgi:hypothetical protein